MIKKISFLIFLISVCHSFSQRVSSFHLLFESDRYELSKEALQKIDSFINTLSNIPQAYRVRLSGHTDNEGDLSYNKNLSLRRANRVKDQFIKKGVLAKNISSQAFAYTKPLTTNASEADKAKNRRVVVEIFAPLIPPQKLQPINSTITFTLESEKGGKFKYPSGTYITVAAGVFVYTDGTAVKGKITLKYKEYRSQLDFISANIPMNFLNEKKELIQFNSGGMFSIEAFQGNQNLKIKPQSDLKINFIKTQNLPEMQFFNFDTMHTAWNKDTRNLSKNKVRNIRESRVWRTLAEQEPIVRQVNRKDSCTLYSCTGTLFSIRKGIELSSSSEPINLSRVKVYFKKIKKQAPKEQSYNLKIISYREKEVEFKIQPIGEVVVYDVFKDYQWVYDSNKKHPLKKDWENIEWLRVKVEYISEDNFNLTLYSNAKKFTLAVKANVKAKGMSKEEMYSYHQKNKETNMAGYLQRIDALSDYDNEFDNSVSYRDNPSHFSLACSDSLFCMYAYSRQWMEEGTESSLSFEEWFDYFNTHKPEMNARYLKLFKDETIYTEKCMKEEKARMEEDQRKRRLKFISDSLIYIAGQEQSDKVSSIMEELSITSLGIWNCDQVQRLKDPVFVKKTYKDSKGKKVEPIIIFVIDKAVSGALTYNGYMNLSPYYFPISSNSENTLIAFDIDNKAYLCTAVKMSIYAKESNFPDIILEPLAKDPQQQIVKALE